MSKKKKGRRDPPCTWALILVGKEAFRFSRKSSHGMEKEAWVTKKKRCRFERGLIKGRYTGGQGRTKDLKAQQRRPPKKKKTKNESVKNTSENDSLPVVE